MYMSQIYKYRPDMSGSVQKGWSQSGCCTAAEVGVRVGVGNIWYIIPISTKCMYVLEVGVAG